MPLPLELPGRPEERVLRQLIAALLFEGIVPHEIAASGQTVWSLGAVEFRCSATRGAFGRVRIVPGSIEMTHDGQWCEATLAAVVPHLPGNARNRARLLNEMEQTVTLSRWNAANLDRRCRRSSAYASLEALLDEGHPYHPCYKARTGFSEADHASYGPEAGRSFQLIWLAVSRSLMEQRLPCGEDEFWQHELGIDVYDELSGRRDAAGFGEDFALLPVHPWQWRTLSQDRLKSWIVEGLIHCLGTAGPFYTASQSVRTLLDAEEPRRAHLKLPLAMVNTSAERILEPHSFCTAPIISAWIDSVVRSDSLFATRYPLTILREYAGMIAGRSTELSGHLGAIWRESPEASLGAGEAAIPFNALMMIEADGAPFINPFVRRYGLDAWMDRLLDISVLPVWHLLVAHGIAVEAHGQNMVLVHKDGWPVRIMLRDFHESIEFSPDFLADRQNAPDFAKLDAVYRDARPGDFYSTDSLDSLRELVMDTLFIYNLTEVSHLLEEHYGYSETAFWRKTAACLAAYAKRHDLGERQAALGHSAPSILTESLRTRKLLAAQPEYHHLVPNIFAVTG